MPEHEQATIFYQSQPILLSIRRSPRRRTVGITIDHQGVRVAAPKRMATPRVLELVHTKARWIAQKQAEFKSRQTEPPRFESGEEFWFLGEPLRLEVAPQPRPCGKHPAQPDLFAFDFAHKPRTSAALVGRTLEVPPGPSEAVRGALLAWYKARAAEVIPQRVEHFARLLGWPAPKVLIRDQKKRWGSCNSRGELRFNWRLVMAHPALLDYVVVHEMAHLKVLDHSKRFWRLVESIMPDYKARHQALTEIGPSLYW